MARRSTAAGGPEVANGEQPAASGESQAGAGRSYMVGIGASAGGLEAVSRFLSRLPPDIGVPLVVVQHMSPTHRSMLVELLSRETELAVREIEAGAGPEPNTVYVTPPNRHVFLRDGCFVLKRPSGGVRPKPSIDAFFASLAEERGEDAVGIVLSGTGSDGAAGVRAIKAAGGLVFAQQVESAKYDGMPKAAMDTHCVDRVLSPDGIAQELAAVVRTQGRVPAPEHLGDDPVSLKSLLGRVRHHTGVDFSEYKRSTVWRRVLRRMATNRVDAIEEYYELTERNPEELTQLAKEILISVTCFFRDPAAFECMAGVLEEMLADKQQGDEVRIWVPGCATGEEAYSIAILLADMLGQRLGLLKVQIFATDVDLAAMEVGRKGIFPSSSVGRIEPRCLERHFCKTDAGYEIDRRLRELVVFARQDLTRDPPFLRLDLVSCRNVLIYFQPALQERVLAALHYALRPGGLVFLGKSESVFKQEALFEAVSSEAKIFRRRGGAGRLPSPTVAASTAAAAAGDARKERRSASEEAFDTLVRGAYVPPCVLINAQLDVLHIHGEVGHYLSLPSGKPDLNLLSLLHKDLRNEVQILVRQAQARTRSVAGRARNALGRPGRMRIVVHPADVDSEMNVALVCFEPVIEPSRRSAGRRGTKADGTLEHELVATREHLQTVIEELETSNEEARALNEELQASNEELQAANEELQSANEELQSTNEELTTVNEELQIKSAELATANADLENVQNSFGFALLVVTEQLHLARYNEIAARQFGIGSASIGERLGQVFERGGLALPVREVEAVLRDGRPRSCELSDDTRHFRLKVFPRLDFDHSMHGAVLTLLDDTDLLRQRAQMGARLGMLERLVEGTRLPVAVKEPSGRYAFANPAYAGRLGAPLEAVLGSTDAALSRAQAVAAREAELQALAGGQDSVVSELAGPLCPPGTAVLVNRFPVALSDGDNHGVGIVVSDVAAGAADLARIDLDESGRVVACSGAAARWGLVVGKGLPRTLAALKRLHKSGGTSASCELKIRGDRWLAVLMRPSPRPDASASALLTSVRD